MKKEQEIKELRDGLYKIAVRMKSNGEALNIILIIFVEMLDWVLDGNHDFSNDGMIALLNKYNWDAVFSRPTATKAEIKKQLKLEISKLEQD